MTSTTDPAADVFVRGVLDAYRATPNTTGLLRTADRRLARDLWDRSVPIETVKDAFLLATLRRATRPAGSPPLPLIRSLAYFLPVIEELLVTPLPPGYRLYLHAKLSRTNPTP